MAKWADYLISCCTYEEGHIEKVGVREHSNGGVGSATTRTRSWVLGRMDAGYSFCTITKDSDGEWRKGALVHIVTVNGKRYLRTDANYRESDNLGELPEC
ncbi:MAG TPA: DUF3892 domain-containing protein [bacterium]|nr:DUF3892 domain-containing protein [bacterium]